MLRRLLPAFAAVLALAASIPLLAFPPPETRIACAALLLLGVVQPLWNLYAVALLGPLFLLNQGASPNIVLVDAMALGAILGECRAARSDGRASFASWPAFLFCILLLVLVSAIPGALANLASERASTGESLLPRTVRIAYFEWASSLEWSLRCVLNWTCAVGVAVVAARNATVAVARRFLQLAAVGLVVACGAGVLDRVGAMSLAELRPSNFGWVEWRRLQATAGHAGWFGQWIVVAWPGLALQWGGSPRRRAAVAAAALLVLVCLLLGSARAAIAAVGAGVLLWTAWLALGRRVSMRTVAIAFAAIAAAGGIAALAVGGGVLTRAAGMFLVADRANYYESAAALLGVFPFGTGVGMHSPYYETWFTPMCRYYQSDHLDCHSLFLHLLVENGLALPLLILAGLVALAAQTLRAWKRLDADARQLVVLLAAVVVGLLVDGLAQYVFYVRAVDQAFWIACGLLCGLTSPPRSAPRSASRWLSPLLLVAVGIYAIVASRAHLARPVAEEYPRPLLRLQGIDPPAWSQWTPKRWRHPIDPDVTRIDFALFRLGTPARVAIAWPDATRETFVLGGGELRRFSRAVDPLPHGERFAGVRWMTIDVSTTYTPIRWDPNIPDPRPLGVNVTDLRTTTLEPRWLDR